MKNKKFFQFIRKGINATVIKVLILLVPISLLIVFKVKDNNLTLDTFFAIDTFCAIVLAFICQAISDAIIKLIERKNEDVIKLTENYQDLVKKYCRANLLHYNGEFFPTVCLCLRKSEEPPFDLCFDSSAFNKKYQLPTQVAEQADYLMTSHKNSKIYNQLNIRLDDLKKEDNKITLRYSQTYYYDSLITNRAMDYCFNSGKSVREIYEPGPFLSSLDSSKLSNHLGFNGFIETSDGKIIFVKRGKKLSIGKNTWATSIGASLKTKYALDGEQKLDEKGISIAIREEIKDELYINIEERVELSKQIIAFYRDIVEGGKPQFLFYYKLDNYTFAEFENNFRNVYEKKNNCVDGIEFLGLRLEECRNCKVTANGFVHNDKHYKMTASAAASLAMLLKYFDV